MNCESVVCVSCACGLCSVNLQYVHVKYVPVESVDEACAYFVVCESVVCVSCVCGLCCVYREVGGWGRVPFSRNLMSPTPRRKWYLTTGRRAH